jgi:hypothetical protein
MSAHKQKQPKKGEARDAKASGRRGQAQTVGGWARKALAFEAPQGFKCDYQEEFRMAPIPIGAISGLILSATASYLITGRLFHPYQRLTAATWRPESWRQHVLAMLLQAGAGAGLGWLFSAAGAPTLGFELIELGLGIWMVMVAGILIQALYVNWHAGFVVGLILDWSVFIAGVLLACAALSTR